MSRAGVMMRSKSSILYASRCGCISLRLCVCAAGGPARSRGWSTFARRGLLRLGRRRIRLEDGRLAFHDGLRLVLLFFQRLFRRPGSARPADRTPRRGARSSPALHPAPCGPRSCPARNSETRRTAGSRTCDRSKSGCSACIHCSRSSAGAPFFEFHAMRFEHVAQSRQSFFGPRRQLSRDRATAAALDDVAAARAADVDEIGLLQLLDEIGEAARAVGAFVEGRIELQHGGFKSPSCGCTARRSSTCRARSTSGMACADRAARDAGRVPACLCAVRDRRAPGRSGRLRSRRSGMRLGHDAVPSSSSDS